MDSSFYDALRQIIHEKGIPQELVLGAIEKGLLAAYKKKYYTDENAVVKVDEETGEVNLYSKKEIVDEVENDVFDIDLETAKEYDVDAEIGDEILIEQKIENFGRIPAQTARQIITQKLKDIEKNVIYNQYVVKKGELISGYYQRERNGMMFINLGKTEGIMPSKHQSPREHFNIGDRVKAYLYDVEDQENRNPKIVLSRSTKEFVKKLFELEVPEIYDSIVQIKGIEREAGYRTKVAVISMSSDVDPVGTCVGMKGVRIQSIIREIEGEKIDVLRYSEDTREYIKNAMSPATILRVLLLREESKDAIVVVPDSDTQLSLAIGKNGLNVRLASRLTGWNIDIKTESEFNESGLVEDSVQKAQNLFNDNYVEEEEEDEETIPLEEIAAFTPEMIAILKQNKIDSVEALIDLDKKQLLKLEGIDDAMAEAISKIIDESVEVVDEESGAAGNQNDAGEDVEEYECGNCNAAITPEMTACPSCGAALVFDEEE